MSRLSAEIEDRLRMTLTAGAAITDKAAAKRALAKALADHAARHGVSDTEALLREAERLAADVHARTGADLSDPEWSAIRGRLEVARLHGRKSEFGQHIEADTMLLVAAVDDLEALLLTIPPRAA